MKGKLEIDKVLNNIVACVEMGGGIAGVYTAVWSAVTNLSWLGLLVYSLVALLFSVSFMSGYLLYCGKKAGYQLSVLCQAIQIPSIATNNFLYMFFSGFEMKYLMPLKANAEPLFGFYAGGNFQFRYGSISINDAGFMDVAGFNLFAFFCLTLLIATRLRPKTG